MKQRKRRKTVKLMQTLTLNLSEAAAEILHNLRPEQRTAILTRVFRKYIRAKKRI